MTSQRDHVGTDQSAELHPWTRSTTHLVMSSYFPIQGWLTNQR